MQRRQQQHRHHCKTLVGKYAQPLDRFLHSDGEKTWRDRESEFENDWSTRAEMLEKWEEGWAVFLNALRSLSAADLDTVVYIRNQGHTVQEAINRQLAHYPYHVGQIVFIAKMCATDWQSLSIPRGGSRDFNAEKFAKPPRREHFTEGL